MPIALKKISGWLTRLFSSLRLAVALLIILAAVSVVGTLIPQEQEALVYMQRYGEGTYRYLKLAGIIDLYHSWGFRILMGLLSANLLVCSVRRLKGVYSKTLRPAAEKSADSIRALRITNELPSPEKAYVLEMALLEKKYRMRKRGRFIYAVKGMLGPWGDMITHMSILLIILGAIVGSLGFVGTVNVYVGGTTEECFNWNIGREVPLGFGLYVEKFELKFYPVNIRVGVRDRTSGEKVGLFETWEKGTFKIPGSVYSVEAESFDEDRREAVLKVYDGARLAGIYDTGLPDGGPQAPPLFQYNLSLDSYKEPVLKSVASTVRILKAGKVVKRGEVEVNNPIEYGGVTIYQSSYGRDAEAKYYTGFQIVRDPGLPLVWAGFALLLAGLFLSFNFYHRQIWVYVDHDKIVIGGTTSKDWQGFMREYSGLVKRFVQEVEP